jgi:hypothetical protein
MTRYKAEIYMEAFEDEAFRILPPGMFTKLMHKGVAMPAIAEAVKKYPMLGRKRGDPREAARYAVGMMLRRQTLS